MCLDILKVIESSNIRTDKINEKTKLLIIEGFTIFNCQPIAALCNLKYFVLLSKEECWNRRKDRIYMIPLIFHDILKKLYGQNILNLKMI